MLAPGRGGSPADGQRASSDRDPLAGGPGLTVAVPSADTTCLPRETFPRQTILFASRPTAIPRTARRPSRVATYEQSSVHVSVAVRPFRSTLTAVTESFGVSAIPSQCAATPRWTPPA